jgi:hypothetical protein
MASKVKIRGRSNLVRIKGVWVDLGNGGQPVTSKKGKGNDQQSQKAETGKHQTGKV